MFKKFVFSLFVVGMLVGPLTTNASTFTSLKAQLEYISNKIANFTLDVKGEVLGVTSAKSINLQSSMQNIPLGGSVTITWSVSPEAVSCVAKTARNNPQWQGEKNPIGGSHVITNVVEQDGIWLDCVWADGEKKHAAILIFVSDNLPKITFTASPTKVPKNINSTTLNWSVTQASKCTYGGGSGDFSQWATPFEKGFQGTQTINNLTTSTTFKIICYGVGTYGNTVAEATVQIIPTIKFIATPTTVPYLGSTVLTWDAKDVYNIVTGTYCKASGDWTGNKTPSGSQVITGIKNNKTFTLTCYSLLGDPYQVSVKVNVQNITGPKCDYPVPPKDCTYIQGPEYNPVTNCGMILDCKLGDIDDGSKLINTDTSSSRVATTNNFCSFTFTKNLGYGNVDSKTSKDVSYLQSVLVDEKLLPSSAVTGKFYSQTRTALANFQKKYKLAQTGKVDTNTRIKLNSLFQDYCNNI